MIISDEVVNTDIYKMKLHEQIHIENHNILKVPGGWIYTDRRNDQAPSGVFVPNPMQTALWEDK